VNKCERKHELAANQVSSSWRSTTPWDGQDDSGLAVASGVYLLRLRTGGSLQTRRLTLLK